MIYLDNAATTKTAPEVVAAMLPYFTEQYGNPSSIYSFASESKKAMEGARQVIAAGIGAEPGEIYFTSGGTEADNWAIKAVAEACAEKGRHMITTAIEHHAVLHTCRELEKKGFRITYLPVDEFGRVQPEMLEKAICPDTVLISVMFANNEIGTIEPIAQIGQIAAKHGVFFHTDAVQAYGQIPVDVNSCSIDLLSASAHKLNGPKGVGFLYIRKGLKIRPLLQGGTQERNRRAGTENLPGIVGFGAAAKKAMNFMEEKIRKETKLRDYLIDRIEREIPSCRLNGDRTNRLPNNVNFSFSGIEGESLVISLDLLGICASAGSACTSGSLEPSHVLSALGLDDKTAGGALRLTLSEETTKEELDVTVESIRKCVERLRSLSGMTFE